MNKHRKKKFLCKHLIRLKVIIQNKLRWLRLKKTKWKQFYAYVSNLNLRLKTQKFLLADHNLFYISKANNLFRQEFHYNLIAKKRFNFFYGNLLKRYIKKQVNCFLKKLSFLYYSFINPKLFFLSLFEKRLDVIIYRSYFVPSIFAARQLIKNKHVVLNNQIITTHKLILKSGDLIGFNLRSFDVLRYFVNKSVLNFTLPTYLKVNFKTLQILYLNNSITSNIGLLPKFNINVNSVFKNYR